MKNWISANKWDSEIQKTKINNNQFVNLQDINWNRKYIITKEVI